jgi:poly(hydroxyalkanoate) granule-associated protein
MAAGPAQEDKMATNITEFANRLADNEFGKAARQSAGRIIRVGRDAFENSQAQGWRVLTTTRKEGEKLQKFIRVPRIPMVEEVQEAAAERFSEFEKMFQKRVDRVLKELGIPTAKEVHALSRRVDELAAKIGVRARRARKAPARAPRKTAAKAEAA